MKILQSEAVVRGLTAENVNSVKANQKSGDSLVGNENLVRKSKNTLATHESSMLMDWNETFCLGGENKLNFTFCP